MRIDTNKSDVRCARAAIFEGCWIDLIVSNCLPFY